MSLLHYGLEEFRTAVIRTLELASALTEMLRLSDDFQVCEPQNLGIVCFRFRPRGDGSRSEPDLDTINRLALERLQLAGDAFVSSTALNRVFWLPASVLNPRTTVEDLHALLAAVRAAVRVVDDATTPNSATPNS